MSNLKPDGDIMVEIDNTESYVNSVPAKILDGTVLHYYKYGPGSTKDILWKEGENITCGQTIRKETWIRLYGTSLLIDVGVGLIVEYEGQDYYVTDGESYENITLFDTISSEIKLPTGVIYIPKSTCMPTKLEYPFEIRLSKLTPIWISAKNLVAFDMKTTLCLNPQPKLPDKVPVIPKNLAK